MDPVGDASVEEKPDWRAVARAQEGGRFVAPVTVADVDVELTDEDRMATTWTNLAFEQVCEAVAPELRALESAAAARGSATSMEEAATTSADHWEAFYERNASKFFKDRHYLQRDYPALFAQLPERTRLLECGCGAGNTVWPLLEANPEWFVYAFDCSATAVRLVNDKGSGMARRLHAFVWDPCNGPLDGRIAPRSLGPSLILC
jgi:hypothetical protein